jgi:serine/threonine protein kinase
MICPRCSVSEISPVSGKCDLCGYSVVAAVALASADHVGELAARQLEHEFTFGTLIGRSRESVVQRATENGSGRAVVVKAILRGNAEPDTAESFRSMMASLAGFDHPHLIPVLRYGSTDSLFWFATEDRGAVSLANRLRADGRMDARACRRLLTQIVSALDYLHRHGLVHGAVKAENVLLDKDGWVRLADPNFVRPRWRRPSRPTPQGDAAALAAANAAPAEPADPWVAPEEIARGERLPAADQYALAVLAIACLSGMRMEDPADPFAHLPPDTPPRMRRALERALDPIPTRRFPGVTDFLWALEEDAAASTAAPMRRVTSDVVMVQGWEPPPDAPRSYAMLGKVAAGMLALVAVLLVTPQARDLLWPEPAPTRPAAGTLSPNTVTPSPAPAIAPTPVPPAAAPSASRHRSARRDPRPPSRSIPDWRTAGRRRSAWCRRPASPRADRRPPRSLPHPLPRPPRRQARAKARASS